MVDERKIGAVEIDRLYDFLDGLQASGYTIDPRQYLAVSDLFMALIARGESLTQLPLKTLIAPLICSTAAEQQDFYQRFDRWYPTLLPATQTMLPVLSSRPKRRWSFPVINRTVVVWTAVAFALIILIIWLLLYLTATGTQLNSNVLLYGLVVVFIGLLGWLGWRLRTHYQENQYITRELANQEPIYTKVPVKAYVQEVMPVMQFKPIVSALRKRIQVPSSEVDMDRTIENALSHNNWLEIVYHQRQVMPEYVVLIDRKSRLDQQARFVQEVLTKLALDGVWLHQYEFNGDPRICFPFDRKDSPLHLKDLKSRHPEARLLIFSGTNELINPLTGLLQDWLESLSHWHDRAILTPDKLQKALFEELESRNFAILPMTFDGLASLVRAFETENAPLLTNGEPNLPAQLIERPMRWTGRDTPSEAEVKALVEGINKYLGENGFYWLCATAVYPELRWELTLYLGNALKDDLGQTLLSPDLLVRLTRLPWFRFGYIPDWIRLMLISSFTPSQEKNTREILSELLSTAYKGEGFDLAFARYSRDSLRNRTRRFIEALTRNSSSESALHDYIFVKFIADQDLRKLALQLPSHLRNFLVVNPFATNIINLFRGRKGNNSLPLRRFTLGRIEEIGRQQGAPTVVFSERIISVPGEDIYVANNLLRLITLASGFYLPLPPNVFGVVVFPDGTSHNMEGGVHEVPPGLYKLQYVDGYERLDFTSPITKWTSDGEKITLRVVLRYRVVDPIAALRINHPVETLIEHVEADVAQYISAHDHNEIADMDSKFLSFFIQRHNRRFPLSKAFIITSIEIKDFEGDQDYIKMRRKALMDERKNKIERKQVEYEKEIGRLKVQYKAENEKSIASHSTDLEKKSTAHKAEIEKMNVRHEKERQEILHQIRLLEIEMDDIRKRWQRQEKDFPQVAGNEKNTAEHMDNLEKKIAEYKTELEITESRHEKERQEILHQIRLLEIEMDDIRKRRQRREDEFTNAIDAISATFSSGDPVDHNILKTMTDQIAALRENEEDVSLYINEPKQLIPEVDEWYRTQLREIDLDNKRKHLQRRENENVKAIDAISAAFSSGYPMNPNIVKTMTDLVAALKEDASPETDESKQLASEGDEWYRIQLREIDLDNKRKHLQRRENEFAKAVDAISATFSNGYPMNPNIMKTMTDLVAALKDEVSLEPNESKQLGPDEGEAHRIQLREIELDNARKMPQREYTQKLKVVEAIMASYKDASPINPNVLKIIEDLINTISEDKSEIEAENPERPIDAELEEARRQNQKQYEAQILTLDEIIKIYKQAYSNGRNLKISETRKIDQIYSIIKQYEDFPSQDDKLEKLTNTLHKLLSPKSSVDTNKD